jgi:glycolate oxidase iron-sulfur subunit
MVEGHGCCGALNHHLGQSAAAKRRAVSLVDDIMAREPKIPFEAIVTTASGCGAVMRDYGFQLEGSHDGAGSVAARTCDILELLQEVPLKKGNFHGRRRIAYHAACSLVHGMKQSISGPKILRDLGFEVVESHDTLCCGSAGVYNILESEISATLQRRKAESLLALKPEFIATGNIGCLAQIAAALQVHVVHPIELIDWATGGPPPSTPS